LVIKFIEFSRKHYRTTALSHNLIIACHTRTKLVLTKVGTGIQNLFWIPANNMQE